MKATFGDLKNSRAPKITGLCADNPAFREITNQALEMLLYEGKFYNTTVRFRFCAIDGCITLPPQIATLEAVAVCGVPATLRTQWFEFSPNGMGIRGGRSTTTNQSTTSGCCGLANGFSCNEAIYRGTFPAFGDIQNGANKKFNLICDLASDVGKRVLVLYYDSNGNFVRTIQDGAMADGEVLLLTQTPGVLTSSFVNSVVGIQFLDERDGQVWGYEFNNDTSTKRLIGQYQAFEVNPDYPRYFFGGIRSSSTTTDGSCQQTLVDSVGKVAYVPVKGDTDLLCVPNIPALVYMMKGINDAEHEADGVKSNQILASALATAKHILDQQLNHFTGDGNQISMVVSGSSPFFNDPVQIVL